MKSLPNPHLRENAIAIVVTILVLLASIIAVWVFKKPGQMGVIESQSMDMSKMAPPTGAVPVAIEPAKREQISGSITYTGSIQAYDNEDVYPRITGHIARMLVYPGDHVRAGQLLVVLDSADSEYAAKAAQAKFQALAATHDVAIARQDYLEKTNQSTAALDAEMGAKKALEGALASFNYWSAEIGREKVLVDKDVVSKQEYENELAQFKEAQAKVAEAQAKVLEATQTKLAIKEATIGMQQHIQHKQEEAGAAKAASDQASVVQSYTRILASEDGVVTKRDVSPGVVVNPGTRIMRIDHISKVRAQAEVATTDIDRIATGAAVQIKPSTSSAEIIPARITAKFPAADQNSRTTIVEALIPNPNYRFLPGQYVVMNILTGSKNALTVPTSAIVWSGQHAQVWKAVGSQQPLTAQLIDVEVGLTNDTRSEIKSGLSAGDQVIYQGQGGLQPSTPVIAVQWGAQGPVQLPTGSQAAGNRLSASNNWKSKFAVNKIGILAYMAPVPLKANSNKLIIQLQKSDGSPLSGATIIAKTDMPTMSMTGPQMRAQESTSGIYQFDANFMTTLWSVDLTIKPPNDTAFHLKLDVEVP
jgi:membrane fusion protein (multidrug efflux system)